jgi:hypothetical protein
MEMDHERGAKENDSTFEEQNVSKEGGIKRDRERSASHIGRRKETAR